MNLFITLFTSALAMICTSVYAQQPNIEEVSEKYAITAERENEAIKAARLRLQQQQKLAGTGNLQKKLRSWLKSSSSKIGINVYGASSAITSSLMLQLQNGQAMLGNYHAGDYQVTEGANGFLDYQLQVGDRQTSWRASEPVEAYNWGGFNQTTHLSPGFAVEMRFLKGGATGIQRGFLLHMGLLHVKNTTAGMMGMAENQFFFPVGVGYVLPGNPHMWVETTGSVLLGRNGFNGVRLDFSLAFGKVKIGPTLHYVSVRGEVASNIASPGVHMGIIL